MNLLNRANLFREGVKECFFATKEVLPRKLGNNDLNQCVWMEELWDQKPLKESTLVIH